MGQLMRFLDRDGHENVIHTRSKSYMRAFVDECLSIKLYN